MAKIVWSFLSSKPTFNVQSSSNESTRVQHNIVTHSRRPMEETWQLSKMSYNPHLENVVWKRIGRFDQLVTKQSAEMHDKAWTKQSEIKSQTWNPNHPAFWSNRKLSFRGDAPTTSFDMGLRSPWGQRCETSPDQYSMLIESLPYPHAIEVESRFIQSSLAGASVRVGFTLTHWYTQKKNSIPSNTFSADVDPIRVLVQPTRDWKNH